MKKKLTLRERFEDNYTAVPVPCNNKKGYKMQYIYYAPWYYWDLPQKQLRGEKNLLFLCSILSLAVFLLAASRRVELNSWQVVYLPCVLALCAHILELFGLLQLVAAKQPTTKMIYQDVNKTMAFAPAARAVCTGIAGAAAIVWMYRNAFSSLALGVTLAFFACAAAACFEFYRYHKMPVRVEENPAMKQLDGWHPAEKRD